MTQSLIAIDPGDSGGFAWRGMDGEFGCCPMPDGMSAQADKLLEISIAVRGGPQCFIERVGHYVRGNSATAAVKFSRHCGHLEAIAYCYQFPVTYLTPLTWMKALGGFRKDKKTRKKEIREAMARRFPELSVTLYTADALAMLCVAMERTRQ